MSQPDFEIAVSKNKMIDRNLKRYARDPEYRRWLWGLPPKTAGHPGRQA